MAIFHQSFISSWIYQSDIYMARFFLSFHLPQNFSSNFVKDITGISRISNFLIKCELFPNIWVWKEPCLTKKCWKNIFRVTTGYPKLGSAQKIGKLVNCRLSVRSDKEVYNFFAWHHKRAIVNSFSKHPLL